MKFIALALLLLLPSLVFAQAKKGISVGEPPADTSPAAELATFKVLDGFAVNLFADETDGIPNPIAIRWDERGRLWCLQTSVYPQPKPDETPDDKIIILEDTDHDGRADKRITFAAGLCQPMGMELAPHTGTGHSVYVGEGEKLWLFHDDDGDDQVDRREVVFSGFGTGDTHQSLNSFIWSPEGALVMHQGLHSYSKVVTPHGTVKLYGAGFWHYHPRSGKLEAFPTGMPLNAWGTAFTDDGEPMMVAGAAGMYWARPMEVSTSDTDVGNNVGAKDAQVHAIPHFLIERFQLPYGGQCIKTQGLTKYCGVDIAGNSHWPEAMQGELITGGFFDNKVYRYQLRDDPEFTSGIEAIEREPLITSDSVAFRPIDVRFGPEGACYIADWYDPIIGHYQASFRHPNRDRAHGRIWRVTAKGRDLAKSDGRWAKYQQHRMALADRPVASASSDEALRMVQDKSPRVRLKGIVAAAKLPGAEALKIALRALDHPIDSYHERALWLAVQATKKHWWPSPHPSPKSSVGGNLPRDGRGGRAPQLDSPSSDPGQPPLPSKATHRPGQSMGEGGGEGHAEATLAAFLADLSPRAIAFLIKKDGSSDLRSLATEMLKASDLPDNVRSGLTLGLVKEGAALLTDDQQARLKAAGTDVAKLSALAGNAKTAPNLREAALTALIKADGTKAASFFATLINATTDEIALTALLSAVLPSEAANKALITTLKEKRCSSEAAKRVLGVITKTGRSEPDLTAVLTNIIGAKNVVPSYDPAWVAALVNEVKTSGDATRGSTVFASTLTNCVACHSIAKKGGVIGPELDAVGRGVPMELLIEAVIWPNRQIKEGYLATNVVMKDGRRLQGYKVAELGGELQLRDFLGGRTHTLKAADIANRTDAGSLMPEGLVALMTRDELRDLIAYLASLGR